MQYGVVKTWNELHGWGFIEDEEGYDYFFHLSRVRAGQKIHQGDRVKFDTEEGQRGPEAVNVTKY